MVNIIVESSFSFNFKVYFFICKYFLRIYFKLELYTIIIAFDKSYIYTAIIMI